MPGGYSKKLALRLDARQFAAYSGTPPTRPHWTAARVGLVAASVVLTLLVAGLAVLGDWLVLRDFPSFSIIAGVPVLMVAWVLRPRVGAEEEAWHEIRRDDAPALFELLDRVAAAAGAPMPHRVVLDAEFNASAGVAGWRRRRTLTIGLPMFGVLAPQQRVELLAHEFGHFVNGDPVRGVLTRPALVTPLIVADLLRPAAPLGDEGPLERLVAWLTRPFQLALSWVFVQIAVGVRAVAVRDHQRAEYCADALAVRLAGTAAVVAGMVDAAGAKQLMGAIAAAERGTQSNPALARRDHPGAQRWREAADAWRAHRSAEELLEKSITEEASLWASHPPSGLRARIAQSWPYTNPSLVLSARDSARIDAELHQHYARAGRDIAWSAA